MFFRFVDTVNTVYNLTKRIKWLSFGILVVLLLNIFGSYNWNKDGPRDVILEHGPVLPWWLCIGT